MTYFKQKHRYLCSCSLFFASNLSQLRLASLEICYKEKFNFKFVYNAIFTENLLEEFSHLLIVCTSEPVTPIVTFFA